MSTSLSNPSSKIRAMNELYDEMILEADSSNKIDETNCPDQVLKDESNTVKSVIRIVVCMHHIHDQ